MTMAPLVLIIIFSVLLLLLPPASSIDECIATNSSQHCSLQLQANDECWNATSFSQLVSSFYVGNNNDRDTSVLPQLRGTVDHLLSSHELTTLLASLPPDIFITAAGYNTDGNNIMTRSQGYTAPVGYAAIGLRELSSMGAASYDKVLQIRELARKTTEQSLHLCPGTLYIDYTTISQKLEGGTHRPHADNCYHYYDEENNNLATCHTSATTTMQHPHPKRVAASILYLNDDFDGGEFYFANRRQGDGVSGDADVVDTLVPVQPGRMIYFTSGAENLHGALPVRQRRGKDEQAQQEQKDDGPSRRLALALWYVTDPELEEYVPPLRDPIDSHQSLSKDVTNDGQQTSTKAATDPNDPNAPEQLFSIRIPSDDNNFVSTLVEDMGVYLTSEKNAHRSFWKVNRYGENGDTLHVLFKDHSAMFSLNLRLEDGMMEVESEDAAPAHNAIVVVERHTDGRKRPSLQYMLQESVMMHGVLDVLSTLISDANLKENEMRKFSEDLKIARETLPARRA